VLAHGLGAQHCSYTCVPQPRLQPTVQDLQHCSYVRLNGRVLQATQSIKKQRVSAAGKPIGEPEHHDVHHTRKDVIKGNSTACGSCYGAETAQQPCCNTCEEVRAWSCSRAAGAPTSLAAAVPWLCMAMSCCSNTAMVASRRLHLLRAMQQTLPCCLIVKLADTSISTAVHTQLLSSSMCSWSGSVLAWQFCPCLQDFSLNEGGQHCSNVNICAAFTRPSCRCGQPTSTRAGCSPTSAALTSARMTTTSRP